MINLFGKSSGAEGILKALSNSLAIIEFDCDGHILSANENFCSALGYNQDEIIGEHHSMFVNPEEASKKEYQQFWDNLAKGHFESGEFSRFRKDGEEIWIQATYNPVLDRNGKPIKVIKFASDITAEKLKSTEDHGKLEAISRAQAVIEFEVDGTILNANENFCHALGYQLDEIKGRHHAMFVDPKLADTEEYRAFWAKLASGEFFAAEYKRFGKGGKEIWIQASYNPIFDMQGTVTKVVKFATDITGRVNAVNAIGHGLRSLDL